MHGLPRPKKEVPTLAEFASAFLDGYARANRQKPSGIAAKETILCPFVPLLGQEAGRDHEREPVQQLKHQLRSKAAKTVNNVLTVLNVLLKKPWNGMSSTGCRAPSACCRPEAVGASTTSTSTSGWSRRRSGRPGAYLIVLLGGEAGLRCGEMMALSGPTSI